MLETVAPAKTPAIRKILGGLVALVAVAALGLFILGAVNPWRYVVLLKHFGDPFEGVFVVFLLGSIAHLIAYPIRSSAGQVMRGRVRATLIGGTVAAGLLAAVVVFATTFFDYNARTVARNPAGDRAVVVVTVPNASAANLHVYAGRGLTARDVGNIGLYCENSTATFTAPNMVHVHSPYGDFDFPLDPKTGKPLRHMGATCFATPVALAELHG